MRRASSLVVLAGCNSVFGNSPVARVDAQTFDATDAGNTCPSGIAPVFSRDFTQVVIASGCSAVSVAGSTMGAKCGYVTEQTRIELGPIGSQLATIAGISEADIEQVRLAHDGQRLSFLSMSAVAVYHLANGAWLRDADIVPLKAASASEISLGPSARVLVELTDGVHEFEEQAVWVDLGLTLSVFPNPDQDAGLHLSGDALRAWAKISNRIEYFDRPDRASPFVARGEINGTQGITDIAIDDSCSTMYFTTLDRIFASARLN